MDAKIMGLDDLFKFDVSYRIPQFQRPYAWGPAQWEALWDDVRKVAEDRIIGPWTSDEILPHFMGAIVLQGRDAETPFGEARRVLVVDGQQRLTTLQLLLKAMQNAFQSSMSDTRQAGELDKFLFNDPSRAGNDHRNETKIRQSNPLDQTEFQEVIRGLPDEHRTPRSIAKACDYFHREIIKWLNKDVAGVQVRADALYRATTDYLKVATITLDPGEKPHFIFEILNTRGEPLKEADHIKNTMMYEADVIDDALKARQLWGLFENDWWRLEDGRGRNTRINIDRFLNYWIIMRVGEIVPIDRTAAEFRKYVEAERKGERLDVEQVAESLREAGGIYRNIEENRLPAIQQFVQRVKTMEIGVIMPPLLWLYTHEVSEEEQLRSIKALESYLVRRMLCNIGSQGLNRLFIELVKSLETNTGECSDIIIDFLRNQSVENRIWPTDRQVTDYLTTRPMGGNVARRKMVFEAIENHIRSEFTEPLGSTAKLTVEHILPQGWSEWNWPLPANVANRDEAEAYRKTSVGLIGNLTLATRELNSRMSNRSWEDKQKALGLSTLRMNMVLVDDRLPVWDEDAIMERSQKLAQMITQIWPHADGI